MPSYAIVGASRGIGLEFVRQLATNPSNMVIATVRSKQGSSFLNSVLAECKHNNVYVVEADVTDHRAMKAAAAEVAKITGGTLDILIHNAARMENANWYRGLTEYDDDNALDEEFLESFKVNTLGVVHSVNAFLPLLRKGKSKKIIVISTGGGEREIIWKIRMEAAAAYGATKAGANVVATKYAIHLESEGFTVVALTPGVIDVSATAVYQRSAEDQAVLDKIMDNIRKGRPNINPLMPSPETVIARALAMIDRFGPEDTGTFKTVY